MVRILIIEDEEQSSSELRSWLSKEGYSVEVARTGREGMKLLKNSDHYEAAIVSWQLQDMESRELCRLVSTSNLFLPILVLANNSNVEDKIAALDAGAQDFMDKPCQMRELSARLRSLNRRYAKQNFAPAAQNVAPLNSQINAPNFTLS